MGKPDFGIVFNLQTGEKIREATVDDLARSMAAEKEQSDGAGAFVDADGVVVFVEGENYEGAELAKRHRVRD